MQTLQKSFSWDYKLRCPLCILCMQTDHIIICMLKDPVVYVSFDKLWKQQQNTTCSKMLDTRRKKTNGESWLLSWQGIRLVSRKAPTWFHFSSPFSSKRLWFVDTVLWLYPSQLIKTIKWLSSLPILMHETFWWWQCSDRCITSLFPHLHTPMSLQLPPPPPPQPHP